MISPTVPPSDSSKGIFGGAETYALSLAKHLAKQNQDVTLLTMSYENRRELINENLSLVGLKTQRFISSNIYDLCSLKIINEIKNNDYDLLHVHQLNTSLSVLSCAIARIQKIPSFLTDHGGGSPFLSVMPQISAKFPNYFMAVSKYSLKWLQSLCSFKESFVIYGGINTEIFSPLKNYGDIVNIFDLSGFNVILYVGKINPHKGIDVLIKSFKFLPKNTKLLIVGPVRVVRYLAFLKSLARKICPGRILIVGSVSDLVLSKFYNSCDILVLPSVHTDYKGRSYRFPELLGLVKFEAMACAKPVIVTNVGGLPEYVINFKNGFVVAEGDEKQLAYRINLLLSDDKARRRMGYTGFKLVQEKFTWENIAKNVITYYKTALKNRI